MTTYCTFKTDNTYYAIESDKIRVVLSEFDISHVPTKNPYIIGIMNIYGDIYTTVKLTDKNQEACRYCIVMKDLSFAILCESVELIESKVLEQSTDVYPRFIRSYIQRSSTQRISVIMIDELIREIRQHDVNIVLQ